MGHTGTTTLLNQWALLPIRRYHKAVQMFMTRPARPDCLGIWVIAALTRFAEDGELEALLA